MKKTVTFDNSLETLLQIVSNYLGAEAVKHGFVLRTASGQLCFYAPECGYPEETYKAIVNQLIQELGAYANPFGPLVSKDDPVWQDFSGDPSILYLEVGDFTCRLIDRRIVGSGWLASPVEEATDVPRIVFASLKGGVGRSTALAVTTAHLSSKGLNVLAIDLDLEAPGLGDILLTEDRLPQYGVLDFLVENNLNKVSETDLDNFVGLSPFTGPTTGRVDVVPVFGKASIDHPRNVLPKLARAMTDDVSAGGEVVSVGNQIAVMIERLCTRESYDVVLIDSRAGLAEMTAPAVLGLGATVLLFGTAQPQTISGYEALFASLGMLAERQVRNNGQANWRLRLKAVYAKASGDEKIQAKHLADLHDVYRDHLYDEEGTDTEDYSLYFDARDQSAPHWPLLIPLNLNFVDFDPATRPSQLAKPFYEIAFGEFLNGIDQIVTKDIGEMI